MSAILHVVSDRQRCKLPIAQALLESARGGADVIQIREKRAPAMETFSLTKQLQARCKRLGLETAFIMNDRFDIALAANMDGVHLAAKSLPIDVVAGLRREYRWRGRIGCSVHSLEEALVAEQGGADYVTFGHIYASGSHPNLPPRGVMALRRIVDRVNIPVIAIGGIDVANLEAVLDTGCSGIAIIGAILDTESPREQSEKIKRIMETSPSAPKVPF